MEEQKVVSPKKLKRVLKKSMRYIKEVRNEFFYIRNLVSSEAGKREIEKKYNGMLFTDTRGVYDKGVIRNVKTIKIYGKKQRDRILIDITYDASGISITIGDNPKKIGVFFARFYDYNCENIQQVIYNHQGFTKIKSYDISVSKDKTLEGTQTDYERPDKTLITALLGFRRRIS